MAKSAPLRRLSITTVAVLATAIGLAACSPGTTDNTGGGDVDTDGVAYAEEQIAPYLERPVSIPDLDPPIPVTEALETLPTGKKFVFVQCGVPECAFLAAQAANAIEAVGAELQVIQVGNDAQSIAEGFQSALDAKPDAIFQAAIDPATWTSQLAAIKEAGIPVVAWTIPDEPAADGITATFNGGATFRTAGRFMADYVIAKSEGTAKTVLFYPPEYTVFKGLAEDYQKEIQDHCSSCTVEIVAAPASEIGSALPGRIVSYLQANPDTDWVAGAFGSVMIGVPQALAAAGVDEGVSTITQAGGEVNFQYLKDGQQTVDLANDLNQEAWMAVDMMSRLTTGQDLDPSSIGARTAQKFLVQDDITFDPADGYVTVPDYQAYFKGLWGVN